MRFDRGRAFPVRGVARGNLDIVGPTRNARPTSLNLCVGWCVLRPTAGAALEPIEWDEEMDRSSGTTHSSRIDRGEHRFRFAAVALAVVVVVLGVVASRFRSDADRLRDQRAAVADVTASLRERLDEARRAAGPNPALDSSSGAIFPLPSTSALRSGAIAVLVTPNDVGPIWIIVTAEGATASEFGLLGGTCDGRTRVDGYDWASAEPTPDGDLRLVANQLNLDPTSDGHWIELHAGPDSLPESLGVLVGPLANPVLLPPGSDPCQ
jgi:type II secretory pathway pseudopilin PulG